jgi:hypothetical protein
MPLDARQARQEVHEDQCQEPLTQSTDPQQVGPLLQSHSRELILSGNVPLPTAPENRPQKRGRADTSGRSTDIAYRPVDVTGRRERSTEESERLPWGTRYELVRATRILQFARADGSMGETRRQVAVDELSADGESI